MLFHRFINTANNKEYLVPLCACATMKTALLHLYTSGQCKRNVSLTYTGRVYKDIAHERAERVPMRKGVLTMSKKDKRELLFFILDVIVGGVGLFGLMHGTCWLMAQMIMH